MEKTELKLEYKICDENIGGIPVIIVAAGSASRMNGTDKQLMPLVGIPVIVRTMQAFENSKDISRIILVTKKESINEIQLLAEKYMISKLSDIVCGGENRHKSVLCGIKMLKSTEETVLIHDGARPFVTERIISDCVSALESNDACLAAIKINDTVKLAGEDNFVTGTLDRSLLYSAQTPQGVNVKKYKEALNLPHTEEFTDDASVMESAGFRVKIVKGSKTNIKITTVDDIAFAQAVIRSM